MHVVTSRTVTQKSLHPSLTNHQLCHVAQCFIRCVAAVTRGHSPFTPCNSHLQCMHTQRAARRHAQICQSTEFAAAGPKAPPALPTGSQQHACKAAPASWAAHSTATGQPPAGSALSKAAAGEKQVASDQGTSCCFSEVCFVCCPTHKQLHIQHTPL